MLSEEKPMDFEQTLPREQHTMRFKGGLVRRIAGIALWTAVAYVLLHLALVPVFSLLTRTEHKKGNTPRALRTSPMK